MFLRRIDPDEPDYDRRTFECAMRLLSSQPEALTTAHWEMGTRSWK